MIEILKFIGKILVVAVVFLLTVLIAFWVEVVLFLKEIIKKIPEAVRKFLVGMVSFIEKVGTTAKNIYQYYSFNKETQQWNETIVTQTIDLSKVPEKFLRMAGFHEGKTIETTDELERQLLKLEG